MNVNKMKHHEESIKNMIAHFKENPEIIALFLNGSVATGTERSNSDIDGVAVVSSEYYMQKKIMTPKQIYNALLAEKVIKALKIRNIQGYYYETADNAVKKIIEVIPENSVVSWGGSVTLSEIGLIELFKMSN